MRHNSAVRIVAALALALGASLTLGTAIVRADTLPRVVPGMGNVVEGNSGSVVVQVPVTLSEPSTAVVTADWVTIFGPGVAPPAPATPGVDFASASGTVVFQPGVTAATIEITVYGDVAPEPDEYVVASFRNATNATIGGSWGLGFGIIDDDDGPPVLTAASPLTVRVVEGNVGSTPMEIPVTLSHASTVEVAVDWRTIPFNSNGFATEGVDYQAASGRLTFPPGTTTATISLAILADTVDEPNENVVVELTNPVNAIFASSDFFSRIGAGLILDDD